jgi:hypothetical protein
MRKECPSEQNFFQELFDKLFWDINPFFFHYVNRQLKHASEFKIIHLFIVVYDSKLLSYLSLKKELIQKILRTITHLAHAMWWLGDSTLNFNLKNDSTNSWKRERKKNVLLIYT